MAGVSESPEIRGGSSRVVKPEGSNRTEARVALFVAAGVLAAAGAALALTGHFKSIRPMFIAGVSASGASLVSLFAACISGRKPAPPSGVTVTPPASEGGSGGGGSAASTTTGKAPESSEPVAPEKPTTPYKLPTYFNFISHFDEIPEEWKQYILWEQANKIKDDKYSKIDSKDRTGWIKLICEHGEAAALKVIAEFSRQVLMGAISEIKKACSTGKIQPEWIKDKTISSLLERDFAKVNS